MGMARVVFDPYCFWEAVCLGFFIDKIRFIFFINKEIRNYKSGIPLLLSIVTGHIIFKVLVGLNSHKQTKYTNYFILSDRECSHDA